MPNIIKTLFRSLSGTSCKEHEALRIEIIFRSNRAHIALLNGSAETNSAQLITAYLLFLSRYFYICDERQTSPVAEQLTNYIKMNLPPNKLADALMATVHATLSQNEKAALAGLFSFPNLPPLNYSEGTGSGMQMAQYSLSICKTNDFWSINFHMSPGPDIILLPITVGVLYHYISDKIEDENRGLLNTCVSQLLATQKSSDCRSALEASRTPNSVISKNLKA